MRYVRRTMFAAAALSAAAGLALAQAPAIRPATAVVAHNGMVVAPEARAARIGVDILKRGGNAVDAAVAVGFALAVTYPRAGNIGGGGFMVIHLAKNRNLDNRNVAIDYRETAPAAATPTMFLDAKGDPDPTKSRDSGLSCRRAGHGGRPRAGAGEIRLGQTVARRADGAGDRTRAKWFCLGQRHRRPAPRNSRQAGALAVHGGNFLA